MTYTVDKNVPYRGRPARYPFASMDVGDSFLVTDAAWLNARTCAYSYGRRHNMKFKSKAEGRHLRIWRIS